MKTNLKLIAIGIIILYCLTPLGAVEINTCDTKIGEQTTGATGAANAHNETKVVNNTDNTDAQTDVRDDVDTKTSVKDNTRDSNSTIATKEVGKTAKDSNDDQSYMFDTDMEVYAEDTCVGSPIKVHCTAHNHQYPNDTRITGRISISANGTVLGYGEMINGKADIQLTHQLKSGNYILNAHYFTNDKYSPADATTTLTVKGEHANLNIKVNNVTPTGDATIDITTNKEINNESVSVKLDSTSSVYDVKITNGEGKLNAHNLKLGKHIVTANYHGNEKFRPGNASATFAVDKLDPNLNINVHDITPSGDALVEITANKEINDEILVKINGLTRIMMMKLKNGEGKFYVHEFNDVTPGKHEVIALYGGNEKFKSAHASATFTVGYDPDLNIKVNNVTPTGDATIDITTNKEINNEFVSVKLDSSSSVYDVKITNGEGKLTVHNLKASTHTVTANYQGNEKFRPGNASATFAVDKLDPNLNITVHNVTRDNDALVEITANKEINDEILVKINGSKSIMKMKLKNGEGKFYVHEFNDVTPGKHKVIVSYTGNEKFKSAKVSETFTVGYDPDLNIKVNNVTPTGDATIDITTNKEINNEFIPVKLDSSSSVYDVKITNGEGKLTVHNLKAGTHTVTANYQGNEKFRPGNASATFAVDKLDPNLNITVHNVTRVDDALVEITANKEINDEILVKINGSKSIKMMKLKNGEGKFYVHEFNDVTPGKHKVIVSYTGNEKFKSAHESATFILRPGLDPNLSIHVEDISAGQNAVAEITANKNLSGNITKVQNPLAEITANKNLSGNVDAKLNTCNNPLAVSNSKLHSTTGNDTTTTVNPKTAGQYLLLQA